MAQNISLWGATYSDVPSVVLPKSGGGTASFTDVSDTTATVSDVLSGKWLHLADGSFVQGTNTGGSGDGYVWQDGNGYVHLSDEEGTQTTIDALTVNASGTYTAASGHAYSPVTVPSGSATTPATTVTAAPSISVDEDGLITASASATKSVTPTVSAGWVASGTSGTVTVNGSNTLQLSTQAAKTVSPTESEQTAVAAEKYTTGAVKVGAISSTYIGSGIARRDSTDLTASGATVTVPSGYYSAQASKSVASGTAGTPTATKGTVSNHSVSVTPSVTNTTGYITGGTKNGTAVTVSASELVSGTLSITSSGTKDVTNYASASVTSGSAATPATTITADPSISVSSSGLITATVSGSKSVTPTVSAGYVTGGTAGTVTVSGSDTQQLSTQGATTITPTTSSQTAVAAGKYTTGAVTVGAIPSEYIVPSGTLNITSNGTHDVTSYASAAVSISADGLEYESGTFTPTADSSRLYVPFSNTHTEPPIMVLFSDADGSAVAANTNVSFTFVDQYRAFGTGYPYSSTAFRYAIVYYSYVGSSSASSSAYLIPNNSDYTSDTATNMPRYWANTDGFHPYSYSDTRYWRANRTYKWVAVWRKV